MLFYVDEIKIRSEDSTNKDMARQDYCRAIFFGLGAVEWDLMHRPST